jgi:putative endonuclease
MSEIISIKYQDKLTAASSTSGLGRRGEELAAQHLKRNGYRMVLSNFKVPVGRNSKGVQVTGEIDLIAFDGETLCFIEVKTRRSDEFAPIVSAVDLRKQRQITRTAKTYLRVFGVHQIEYRFDVVTVLIAGTAEPKIELIKSFWSEASFKKRNWYHNEWFPTN